MVGWLAKKSSAPKPRHKPLFYLNGGGQWRRQSDGESIPAAHPRPQAAASKLAGIRRAVHVPHARGVYFATERRAVEPGSVGRQVLVATAEDEQLLVEKLFASSERGPSNNAPGSPQQLCMVCSQVITLCAPMNRFVAEARPYTCSLTQSASSKHKHSFNPLFVSLESATVWKKKSATPLFFSTRAFNA